MFIFMSLSRGCFFLPINTSEPSLETLSRIASYGLSQRQSSSSLTPFFLMCLISSFTLVLLFYYLPHNLYYLIFINVKYLVTPLSTNLYFNLSIWSDPRTKSLNTKQKIHYFLVTPRISTCYCTSLYKKRTLFQLIFPWPTIKGLGSFSQLPNLIPPTSFLLRFSTYLHLKKEETLLFIGRTIVKYCESCYVISVGVN